MSDINQSSEGFRTETGLGRVRLQGFFVGIVKGNADPQRMGRLAVYIPEIGGDPKNPDTWYTVGYASPFAGATNIDSNKESGQDAKQMTGTQKSYGWWAVPPDINNEVLVCFANGDPAKGFWVGSMYQQFMNHMVPAMGLNRSTNDEVNQQNLPPVCEYNRKDPDNATAFWDPKRPIFEPLYNGLREQGLFTDPERGPATTGARRESPSKVFGWSTPRGNNIHIDDDDQNEFIRMRARSGAQVMLHETTGYIYMISKKGNSWFEISDEGIDMYSKKTISMRAEEGINIHSDGHISVHGIGALHGRGNYQTSGADAGRAEVTTGPHSVTAKQHNKYADEHGRNHMKATDTKTNPGAGGGNNGGNGQGSNSNGARMPTSGFNGLNNKGTNDPIKGGAEGGRDGQNVINYIRQQAIAKGVDPDKAVAIARAEGLNPNTLGSPDYGNPDAAGRSYGPFQLYLANGAPSLGTGFQQKYGESPNASNWQQQVDYSLDNMRTEAGLRNWSAYKNGSYRQYLS